MAAEQHTSPPISRSSSMSSRGRKSAPSLDLSDLPPLIQPSPPTNTLIITNLNDPSIFHVTNLSSIRDLINSTASLYSFSPLKSFRRIIVSFLTVDDSIKVRSLLDGESIMGDRIRVYFGDETPINATNTRLEAPQPGKLFFISPPPSPPAGWEVRNEEPPNKDVHAEDLASALAKLHSHHTGDDDLEMTGGERPRSAGRERGPLRQRSSSSAVIFDPLDHGVSPDLPAIAVEDTSMTPEQLSPVDQGESNAFGAKIRHTARPPVELMSDA